METPISGEVLCDDTRQVRTIRRFVEKHIMEWIRSKRPAALQRGPVFHVSFQRLGGGHTIGCHIKLRLGPELWIGAHYGEDPHQALKHGLEHMARAPQPS